MSASLPNIQYRRIARLFEQGNRVWNSRPDVQKTFPDIRHWDYWFWLLWLGSQDYPEIADLIYPDPPSYLMQRVTGQITSRSFLESGLVDCRRMYLSMAGSRCDFGKGGHILDFGCGCGRILRLFSRYAGTCEFHGGDVDAGALDYCAKTLDFARFSVLQKSPPSAYPNEYFDGVYAYSVFSHLPERMHRLWLEDLFRIMRPGAILVLTVQGRRVIDLMVERRWKSDVPSSSDLLRELPKIEREGFAFYPYERLDFDDLQNREHFAKWDLKEYGSCFIMENYVRSQWTGLFEVVSWRAAPDGWQDYVVLR